MFELYASQTETPLDGLDRRAIKTLLLGGIVNPMGPTLNVVAAVGRFEPNRSLPLVHLMLNPFSQEAKQIGHALIGERWLPVRDFEPLTRLAFGACPTLVLASNLLDEEESVTITARWLASFGDARATMDSVNAHVGDPWTRVSEEMDRANAALGRGKTAKWNAETARCLNEPEALAFARTVLSQKHCEPEIQAFLYAWKGAIDFQRDHGGGGLAQCALSPEAFQNWLLACVESCRLPADGRVD